MATGGLDFLKFALSLIKNEKLVVPLLCTLLLVFLGEYFFWNVSEIKKNSAYGFVFVGLYYLAGKKEHRDQHNKKKAAIMEFNKQKEEIAKIYNKRKFGPEFKVWHRRVEKSIVKAFGETSEQLRIFNDINYDFNAPHSWTGETEAIYDKCYKRGLKEAEVLLDSFIMDSKT